MKKYLAVKKPHYCFSGFREYTVNEVEVVKETPHTFVAKSIPGRQHKECRAAHGCHCLFDDLQSAQAWLLDEIAEEIRLKQLAIAETEEKLVELTAHQGRVRSIT